MAAPQGCHLLLPIKKIGFDESKYHRPIYTIKI